MKTELHYYDIYPKVFLCGKETTVTIKPLGFHAAFNDDEYTISVHPISEGSHGTYPDRPNYFKYTVKPNADGTLSFTHTYSGEQEHYIRVWDKNGNRKVQLSVYSLNEDMQGRYPFKGDLHMHTCRSDGREAPEIVCANYRKYGYDFFAITDHGRYYPSLDAIAAYKNVPIEFNIVPGEEIHLPGNDIHIVNFGGEFSVNALVEGTAQYNEGGKCICRRSINPDITPDTLTREQYEAEVNALIPTLNIPDGIEKFPYAACVWIFNQIKKGNGLGIFAHPYWISDMFQVPETFTDYMMETKPFDAYEVLGGENYFEQNGFQTVKYYEDVAKGRKYPIVGSTDSHSSVNNRNGLICSTIVFAPENERKSLVSSIKDFYSVAVDTISAEYRIVGDFRLVKYANFLINNYFPIHDDLCFEEGRAMKDYVCGVDGAEEILNTISGRMKKMREKYFSL